MRYMIVNSWRNSSVVVVIYWLSKLLNSAGNFPSFNSLINFIVSSLYKLLIWLILRRWYVNWRFSVGRFKFPTALSFNMFSFFRAVLFAEQNIRPCSRKREEPTRQKICTPDVGVLGSSVNQTAWAQLVIVHYDFQVN